MTILTGVGPARAECLRNLGIENVEDLLLLVPRALERQGNEIQIEDAERFLGSPVSIRGRLRMPKVFRRGRRSTVSANLEDGTGRIALLFFNQPWQLKNLRGLAADASSVHVYGRLVRTRQGIALSSPRFVSSARPLPESGTLLPVYGLSAGIGQGFLRGIVAQAVRGWSRELEDPLRAEELAPLGLPRLSAAATRLQDPGTEERFRAACRRLALEELLGLQARFQGRLRHWGSARARSLRPSADTLRSIQESLPHAPTPDQLHAMGEIAKDLGSTRPMRRLLQGDVGSGKTMVALHAMALAVASGGQVALIAPTELLADQHAGWISAWFQARGVESAYLSGSLSSAEQSAARRALHTGRAAVVIGTHALFGESVRFKRLDLVVIDEQQRFGVEQKRSLLTKGDDLHALLLSATPIPRTLALSMYGDLDVSRIRAGPTGRGTVETHLVAPEKRADMLRFLGERMATGERVFWVCPRISVPDEGAQAEARSLSGYAERAFDELTGSPLAVHGIELLHGRLPAATLQERIERFRSGASKLVVGTTLLEVGIDVPAATVMVIEGADGLGLSQLHQLRGRVGRGSRRSYCLLLVDERAAERLCILRETQDGFRIAEADLMARGMGDLVGLRQAGRSIEGLEEPLLDEPLVSLAREVLVQRPELVDVYLDRLRMRARNAEGLADRRVKGWMLDEGPALV